MARCLDWTGWGPDDASDKGLSESSAPCRMPPAVSAAMLEQLWIDSLPKSWQTGPEWDEENEHADDHYWHGDRHARD